MAGRQGLEPRYADPESAVLPLDDLPMGRFQFTRAVCRLAKLSREVLPTPSIGTFAEDNPPFDAK